MENVCRRVAGFGYEGTFTTFSVGGGVHQNAVFMLRNFACEEVRLLPFRRRRIRSVWHLACPVVYLWEQFVVDMTFRSHRLITDMNFQSWMQSHNHWHGLSVADIYILPVSHRRIESRWGRDFPWGPSSLLYNMYQVSFPGVMRPEPDINDPPLSSAEVKETVELYL